MKILIMRYVFRHLISSAYGLLIFHEKDAMLICGVTTAKSITNAS